MSEHLLPAESAQKSIEHEKWKAMVDSVIEFISASREMLHVLNDRIKDEEKLFIENKRKMEEETDKLQCNEETMNSNDSTEGKLKSSLTVSTPNLDIGDQNIEEEKEQHDPNNSKLSVRNLKRSERKFVSRIPRTKSCVDDRSKCK